MLLSMKETEYQVVEIFDSIDGEGITAGCLATFIRLAGCNIRCSYCDTPYALDKKMGKPMKLCEIMEQVRRIGNNRITITGGEPLFAADIHFLIKELAKRGYKVNVETNGTIPIIQAMPCMYTLDYKTIFSGMNNRMYMENINLLRANDVLKIVCKESDFEDIENMLSKYKPSCSVFLSPIFGEIKPAKLVDFAKRLREHDVCDARVQIQLHKIIWDAEKRGV